MTINSDGRPTPPSGADSSSSSYTGPSNTASAPSAGSAPQTSQAPKAKNGGGLRSFFTGLLGGIVAIALVFCLGNFTPVFNAFKGGSITTSNGNVTITPSNEDATLAEAVASKTLGSVVTIYVYSNNSSWNQFFGESSSSSSPSSLGSGVIISDEGNECYIITNSHVVEDASKLRVKVGETEYDGSIVGTDPKTDLAVVKINASGLAPIEWGNSDDLKVGEWVMAIGSPFGYEQTVTTGIISAMYRSDVLSGNSGSGSSTVYTDMIQTDAAINPGNSGGALVDAQGRLIGINTYISSSSQSSAGLGFAIPVNTVKRISEQLINGKAVTHAFLGITMGTSDNPAGVAVTSVYKGTAAANAGLQTGDVITKINGNAITSPNDISILVSSKNVGDTLDITYVRNGQEKTTTATLGGDDANATEYAENGAPATNNGNSQNRPYGGNGGSGGNGGGFFGFPFGF